MPARGPRLRRQRRALRRMDAGDAGLRRPPEEGRAGRTRPATRDRSSAISIASCSRAASTSTRPPPGNRSGQAARPLRVPPARLPRRARRRRGDHRDPEGPRRGPRLPPRARPLRHRERRGDRPLRAVRPGPRGRSAVPGQSAGRLARSRGSCRGEVLSVAGLSCPACPCSESRPGDRRATTAGRSPAYVEARGEAGEIRVTVTDRAGSYAFSASRPALPPRLSSRQLRGDRRGGVAEPER